MKNMKILFGVFVVTFLMSKVGVYAYSTGVFNISKVKVGGADSSVYTSGARTKVKEGNQKLTDISQTSTMKAKLQFYSTATKSWGDGTTTWQTMKSGTTLTFVSSGVTSFYPAIMLGDYRVKVAEVSWHLSDGTLTATYNPGN